MENQKYLLSALIVFGLIFAVGFSFFGTSDLNVMPQNAEKNIQGIEYHSSVCPTVVRANGDVEIIPCSSNVLYNTGAELIESAMGDGAVADAVDWIELGNASLASGVPVAASTEDYTALNTACFSGTNPVAGTVTDNSNGNWTISTTFTSSCDDVLTNVTHLINDADVEFAGNNFTLVTLQTNDQLTVNWTVWVT